MVVVVIAGILAALAFASLRSQMTAAWQSEGLTMVQSIMAAEAIVAMGLAMFLPAMSGALP